MGPLPPFHLHWDVWGVLAVLAVGFWYAERRLRPLIAPDAAPAGWRHWWMWYSGLAVMWISADWPVHDLAEQSLFTLHMVEHMLIGYVVPPMLLSGMPRWMADATLGRLASVLRPLSRPVVGFFAFNGMLVIVHVPAVVAVQNTSEPAHLALHTGLFLTGLLLFLPVFSPTPAIPRISPPMRMLYLFLNTIIPTVPASFLTFSDVPLYPVYGDAASEWGLTAVADQTLAGVVMKLGGGFYLVGLILAIWVRWNREERGWDRIERELAGSR